MKVTVESLGATVGPCPLASIESLSPRRGPFGTSVVLSGTNLEGVTGVTFDGRVAHDFSVDSPTQITATLPHGATSGPVSVATADGSTSGAGKFTVTHKATLALRLRSSSQGGLVATGSVRIPDGTDACQGGRRVIIENKVNGSWRQRGVAVTHTQRVVQGESRIYPWVDPSTDQRTTRRSEAISAILRDSAPVRRR